MKLLAPCQASDFITQDINGQHFQLSDYIGKPVILSFFRDASCPFCNMRVFEYTQKHKEWSELGIEMVAVFSSSSEQIRNFVAKHPRPFTILGDPELKIYDQYGIEHSVKGLLKALIFKMPRVIMGFVKGAKADKNNPNGKIVPADFLIGPNGKIVDLWYGRDASDNIPMKRLDGFASKVKLIREKQALRLAQQAKQRERQEHYDKLESQIKTSLETSAQQQAHSEQLPNEDKRVFSVG